MYDEHLFHVLLGNERPDVGVGVHRVTDLHLRGPGDEPVDELVMDRFVDEDPGAVGADFPLGVEVGHEGRGNGVVEVGIVKDDQRALPAQLQSHVLESGGGVRHHDLAGPDLAGERDLGHPGMGNQSLAGAVVTLDHVEDTVG